MRFLQLSNAPIALETLLAPGIGALITTGIVILVANREVDAFLASVRAA